MRQSVAPTRASHAASSINPNPASIIRLQEKKKEFEAVAALEKASAAFVKRIEGLGDDCDVMADAGLVHGQVLEQWPNMFRILGLFLANREQVTEPQEDGESSVSTGTGSCLVRIPIDELQVSKPAP
jgi:DASH complex subunit DAD2